MISVASATSTRNWSVSHPVWASPVLASKLPSIPWILAISSSWGQLQNNYYLIYNACWVVHISNHTAKYEGNIYLCPAKVAWLHSMFSLKSSRNDWYTKLRYNYMHIMGKTILRNERVIHPKTYLISHVFPETPLSLPHPNHTCCIRLKRLRCKNSNMVFDAVTMWQELSFFTKMEKSEPRTVSIYVSACESLVQNGSIRQIWFITTWSIFNELPNR